MKRPGGVSVILIGLILVSIAAFFGIKNYNFINKSVKTNARLKSIYKGSGKYFTPTYEYKVNEKEYTFEGPSSTYDEDFKIGSIQIVYYNPEDPEDVMLGTFMTLWFVPVLLGGMGLVFTLVGIVTLISGLLNKNARSS